MNPFERPRTGQASVIQPRAGEAAKKQALKQKKTEQELRAERLDLIRRWRTFQIKWNPSENRGRLVPTQRDIEQYREQQSRHGGWGMYGDEGAAFAEYMVMEMLDADGVIAGTRSVMRGHAYAYDPADPDDLLRGTDVLALYTGLDEERERLAYPVAIDVTSSVEDAKVKQMHDLRHLMGGDPVLSRVYWYDTKSEEAGLAFDQPLEGKIPALNTTVYVPRELAELYLSPQADSAEAAGALKRVGGLSLEQQRWQLELSALLLTGGVRPAKGGLRVTVDQPTRTQVLTKLEAIFSDPEQSLSDRAYAAKALSEILPSIWEARERAVILPADMKKIQAVRITDAFEALLDDTTASAAAE